MAPRDLKRKAFPALLLFAAVISRLAASSGHNTNVEFVKTTTLYGPENLNFSDENLETDRFTECPTEVREGYIEEDISVCPWYYEEDYDSNRYPSSYRYAVTPCSTCIGNNRNEMLRCESVNQTITVWDRIRVDGSNPSEYRYQPRDLDITVGYTCVKST